jgi:hypothetical protein
MKTTPIAMEGFAKFFTFAYLRGAAVNAFDTARANPRGSNYHRVSAALFSAFAVEAHLNHIGEARLSYWGIVEPKLSWRQKLDLIAEQLEINLDFGRRPVQTLTDLFRFRDRLAELLSNLVDDGCFRRPFVPPHRQTVPRRRPSAAAVSR